MADNPRENGSPNDNDDPERDFGVEGRNPEIDARTERLVKAVERAGGPKAVAASAGMSLTTLNNYRRGRDMKADALVRLADACRVSVEWLATGRGEMPASWSNTASWPEKPLGPTADGTEIVRGPALPLPNVAVADTVAPEPGASLKGTPKAETLFATLDMTRMGEALRAAVQAFETRGVVPEWRRLAQVAAILYDAGPQPEETVRAHIGDPD